MNTTTLRLVIAVFLILHGLMHYSLTTVPLPEPGKIHTPFWPSWWRDATDSTWLASHLGLSSGVVRGFGSLLWLAATLTFALAGLGRLGVPALSQIWPGAAVIASIVSLVLFVFYWHPWYVVGAAIDLALLAAIYFHRPDVLFTA